MRTQILSFLSLSLLVLVMACHKLPEGGTEANFKLSIKKMDYKSTYWDLENYIVNGIDSTEFVIGNNDPELRKKFLRFFKYSRDIYYQSPEWGGGRTISYHGAEFTITNGASTSTISTSSGSIVVIRQILTPNGPPSITWNILKCKNDELILGSQEGKYRLEFRKN